MEGDITAMAGGVPRAPGTGGAPQSVGVGEGDQDGGLGGPGRLAAALEMHRAGQFGEAEARYRALIDQGAPRIASEALHRLGVLRLQAGDVQAAVALLSQAIARYNSELIAASGGDRGGPESGEPKDCGWWRRRLAEAYNDLGCLFRGRGFGDEAAGCFRHAQSLAPDYLQPLANLGDLLLGAGHAQDAAACFRALVARSPESVDARFKEGVALLISGATDQAELCFLRVLDLAPGHGGAANNLGTLWRLRGQPAKALDYYRRALAGDPNNAEAHHNLGTLHNELGDKRQALSCLQTALALNPRYAEAHNSLGNLFWETGLFTRAEVCYREAMALRPDYREAINNLANVLQSLSRLDEAEHWYRRTVALTPDSPEANNNLAMCLLKAGRLREGFRLFEWRWKVKAWPSKMPAFSQPLWQGEALGERRLLIHCEQGYGDSFQFLRLVQRLPALKSPLTLLCPALLARLLRDQNWLRERGAVVGDGEPLPAFDCHVPLMSLAVLQGIDLDDLPGSLPYLTAPASLVERWGQRFPPGDQRLRVGLVWETDPRGPNDFERWRKSLSFEKLAGLLALDRDIHFLSLQKSGLARPRPADPRLTDWTDDIQDFADTAAVIAQLDLVITIDTAVSHLAGAMGKPVWVLLRADACWRWLCSQEDSPWYSGMRLFRQADPNDWESVLSVVRCALMDVVANDRRAR